MNDCDKQHNDPNADVKVERAHACASAQNKEVSNTTIITVNT